MSQLVKEKILYSVCEIFKKWYKELKKRDFLNKYENQLEIHPSVFFGKYTEIEFESSDSKLIIQEGVYFRKFCSLFLFKEGILKIGKKVFFNNYCSINCLGRIEIGDNTLFGEGVRVYDHNHTNFFNEKDILNIERDDFKIGTVKVGHNCWIGSNVTILKDVEIGDNVIIGANSLIYKSIPSNSVVKHSENLIITR